MAIDLYEHQKIALEKLKPGSILCGGVGSGKSRTSLAYYFIKECRGNIKINGKGDFAKMKNPKDLYIITTAKKRDSLEWDEECSSFMLSRKSDSNISGVKLIIDSWNNITKYINVKNAFFIFDEQRLIGSGVWVKSFLKIAKSNNWILLTATPGDTWYDYIPVFIANGFYKNRTEFLRFHAVYSRHSLYPKIDRYVGQRRLEKLRNQITVLMDYVRPTKAHDEILLADFNKEAFKNVMAKRWNVFSNKPIQSVSELYYTMRKVVNNDPSRLEIVKKLLDKHPKVIIFYNFNYELNILKNFANTLGIEVAEWNGHLHQQIPNGEKWMYLVQYSAGAEGWNCISTNTIIFFSQNYSYKTMVQAAGRIDRLNTPFSDLYYYHIRTTSFIDLAIARALREKRNFNIHNEPHIKKLMAASASR